jgi:hypothetical protein
MTTYFICSQGIIKFVLSGKKKLFAVFDFLRQMIENLSGDRYNDVKWKYNIMPGRKKYA